MTKEAERWTCPFCGRLATIREDDQYEGFMHVDLDHIGPREYFEYRFVACPNPECGGLALRAGMRHGIWNKEKRVWAITAPYVTWQLIPRGRAKVFPDYIPAEVRSDYREACLIAGDSPKAAATLARRCLQGMIRDFWGIKRASLKDEIDALREKIDQATWKGIDAVRRIGNIGAHTEMEVGLIVEVDPGEAEKLIGLVETLLKEWYVGRHDREQTMRELNELAAKKDELRGRKGAGKE